MPYFLMWISASFVIGPLIGTIIAGDGRRNWLPEERSREMAPAAIPHPRIVFLPIAHTSKELKSRYIDSM
jgi:hypothetical protein